MALGQIHASPGFRGLRPCGDGEPAERPPSGLVAATVKSVRGEAREVCGFLCWRCWALTAAAPVHPTNIPIVDNWVTLSTQYRASQLCWSNPVSYTHLRAHETGRN